MELDQQLFVTQSLNLTKLWLNFKVTRLRLFSSKIDWVVMWLEIFK